MKLLERKIFKVSQISSAVRMILESNFSCVWIEGEISNLSEPNSGHIYFSIKDEFAQVRAVMFRNKNLMLKFKPKNGMQVIIAAQVSIYEPRGDYQLIVDHMEPWGDGALHAQFLQLKAKLETEGLFDVRYKKELPKMPQCIGIITSPTGAAVRDILSVLKRRFSGISVFIYSASVQGKDGAQQIVEALQVANKRNECDVLILTRGGGSLEDLWCFNEEIVARAIFASDIPIISAVGHETDFTIADFVADIRAATPSAAAELVVPSADDWYSSLLDLKRRLINLISYKLQTADLLLTNLCNRLQHPRYYLEEKAQKLDEIERRLYLGVKYKISDCQHGLAKASASLDLVSPLATLERGYAIVTKAGKIVKTIKDVAICDPVHVRLSDGSLCCLVEKAIK